MSSSDYTPGQVYEVDPATLVIGTNVRTDIKERSDFAKSIKALGVLEPITAYIGEDGALVVYRGQRRTLTAAKVGTPTGTVPVRVLERPEDAERIVAQVSENLHRAEMSAAEERDAIEQLALLGVSAAQIAKRTAIEREQVNAALKVAKSETARSRMDNDGLTLEQAAILAEFEDDPEALSRLEQQLSWGGSRLEHLAQQLRDERADRERLRAEAERLRGEGVPVLDPDECPSPRWEYELDGLVRVSDGQPVPEEEWPSVPGAAVVLEMRLVRVEATHVAEGTEQEPTEVETEDLDEDHDADEGGGKWQDVIAQVWVCTDPEAAGLCQRWQYRANQATGDSGGATDPEQAAAKAEAEREAKAAERRRVIENNKAWRSAETVRREWLAEFVQRKTPPKGAEALICRAVLDVPAWLERAGREGHPLLTRALTGKEPSSPWTDEGRKQAAALRLTNTGSPKAHTMRALAAVLTAWEASTSVSTWRNPGAWDRHIMQALTEWGYQPSEVEELLLPQPETDETAA